MLLEPPKTSMPVRQTSHGEWLLALLLFTVFLAIGGGAWYQTHQTYKHFAVHEPGKVYRCAWVEADVMAELVRKHQVKTVLNLCRPEEMGPTRAQDERRAVESAGAKFLELPLPDTVDPWDFRIAGHRAVLLDPANYPLLVHCQHGVNRTARTLAMYEVLVHHADGEAAVKAMPLFGRRKYGPLEYEFARNFTRVFRNDPLRTPPPRIQRVQYTFEDDEDAGHRL